MESKRGEKANEFQRDYHHPRSPLCMPLQQGISSTLLECYLLFVDNRAHSPCNRENCSTTSTAAYSREGETATSTDRAPPDRTPPAFQFTGAKLSKVDPNPGPLFLSKFSFSPPRAYWQPITKLTIRQTTILQKPTVGYILFIPLSPPCYLI